MKKITQLCSILFILFSITNLTAADIYVDSTATGSANGTSWTDAYTTVSAAYAAAATDDVILIAAGTYTEGEITIAKNITLKGGYPAGGGIQDFANNTTTLSGGGTNRVITINSGVTASLEGLIIKEGNSSTGGGIRNGGTLAITNSNITGNSADNSAGGGIFNDGTIILTNSSIIANTSGRSGGGIFNGGTITLTNSNITANTSGRSGGGLVSIFATFIINNSIIYNNTPDEYLNAGTQFSINNSLIKGENPEGNGNIDALVTDFDPLFTDPIGGDYTLQVGSPLINTGDTNANNTAIDLIGNPRVTGSTIDIGAHEYIKRIYVDQSASGTADGTSWADAYTTVSAANTAAANDDNIFIAAGNYIEGEIIISKNITVKGGYPTGGGIQDFANNITALSGGGINRVITINAGVTASLEGLTIKEGNSSTGGGINNDGTLTLTNSIITGNSAISGGGIQNDGTLTLTNSSINNNNAGGRFGTGGGINNDGTLTLTNSSITDNSATTGGGVNNQGTATFTNSIIYDNTPSEYTNNSTITFSNSLVKGQNPSGTGNIDATVTGFDPLFTDADSGDYSLLCNSPLVNGGDATANSTTTDLAGNARVVGSSIDIGAYEQTITPDDASFSYSAASYNATDTDPTPTISGLAGGTFSSTSGLSINSNNGNIDLSVSTPAIYTVTYTTAGTCPNTATFEVTIVDSVLSIAEYEIEVLFDMYPNPAVDLLTISIPVNTVSIYSALGGVVLKTTESSFSVAALPSGIYFMTIETDRGAVSKKLIKK